MTSPGDRDHRLEQWLRTAAVPVDPPSADCLDAETAAAWVGGRLSGARLDQAQLHVSECGRCQALVGALVRVESVAPAPQGDGVRHWRRWFTWAIPLAGAAAATLAIAVWVRTPLPLASPASTGSTLQTAAPATIPDRRNLAEQSAAAGAEPSGSAAAMRDAAATAATPSSSAPLAKSEAPVAAPEPPARPAEARSPAVAPAERLQLRQERAPSAANATAEERARPTGGASGQTRQLAAAPPASPPPAGGARADALASSSNRREEDAVAAPVPQRSEPQAVTTWMEVVPRSSSSRWRFFESVVQRSTDGGRSWRLVDSGASAPLLAGSAPSADVCWLVGRSGTVVRTSDGTRWDRLRFPVSVDLVSVQAIDARSATVTAANGTSYVTADGGETWSANRQP